MQSGSRMVRHTKSTMLYLITFVQKTDDRYSSPLSASAISRALKKTNILDLPIPNQWCFPCENESNGLSSITARFWSPCTCEELNRLYGKAQNRGFGAEVRIVELNDEFRRIVSLN
jgi:hypothetical protein